ncbi:hypothetical protein ACFSHT_30525 [Paraburkholderia silviterrae]|uniref:Uncharacterized protein n=1 Tax=Paraburkholderia silviterrae TaxID=2528715 RepID=A0A4R5LZM7_9BURK|nr:hypothetical protein [Paraburkholderia silviterrae]TDG18100.1 hypothetical protein EYW47_35620 [Paraburkholderia silviterrae]
MNAREFARGEKSPRVSLYRVGAQSGALTLALRRTGGQGANRVEIVAAQDGADAADAHQVS